MHVECYPSNLKEANYFRPWLEAHTQSPEGRQGLRLGQEFHLPTFGAILLVSALVFWNLRIQLKVVMKGEPRFASSRAQREGRSHQTQASTLGKDQA